MSDPSVDRFSRRWVVHWCGAPSQGSLKIWTRCAQVGADLETALDSKRFVRVHRSYILNIDPHAKIELYAKDSRIAILLDGTNSSTRPNRQSERSECFQRAESKTRLGLLLAAALRQAGAQGDVSVC